MCLSTLFCADDDGSFLNLRFENDVKMYGTETNRVDGIEQRVFENDVKMYGTETWLLEYIKDYVFENDVKMYGTETDTVSVNGLMSLRMM